MLFRQYHTSPATLDLRDTLGDGTYRALVKFMKEALEPYDRKLQALEAELLKLKQQVDDL